MNKLTVVSTPSARSADVWLSILRQQVTGNHSRAGALWDKLKPYQRDMLIFAARLPKSATKRLWREFTREDMRAIYRGLKRLFILKAIFDGCPESDFIPAADWGGLSINPKEINQSKTNNVVAELNNKAELLNKILNH
ncbi:hypothetical protein [Budvicia aquatica]|uniref:Uncharacterized protein n=1 Tax=Budvicia aquatica TaxID=82979 RepID=A0A2C6DDG6_9GAMM|nr:hypothetical protein [Budvicia aquatica]PHI29226.1 hypothetical protein CRN84_07785 [Budvicia aquatica]VFS47436.1 Uncharacterised protein [Budvicia aquatica]